MVWGEKNSRDFLDWADFCRNNVVKEKSINTVSDYNFANDKTSEKYKQVKNTILNTIENYKSISVQQLYNVLPVDIVANPTIGHVILQLYFEDNLKIQGQQKSTTEKETNFTLMFVKKVIPKQKKVVEIQNNIEKKQSNIEDIIDNSWMATGRKLEFEEKEKKEKLNINLRRSNGTPSNTIASQPNVDVRDIIKDIPKVEIEPVQIPDVTKEIIKDIKPNLNYIQIPKEKVEEVKIEPVPQIVPMKMDLEYRPNPKQEIVIEDKVFYNLSAYDLYYIWAFLYDAAVKEKENKNKIVIIKDIVDVRANIKFIQEKSDDGIGKKILRLILCITIIGIPFALASLKNKVRKKAIKDYRSNLKNSSYEKMKESLKNIYPKIIEF